LQIKSGRSGDWVYFGLNPGDLAALKLINSKGYNLRDDRSQQLYESYQFTEHNYIRMTANGVHTININTNNTEISYVHLISDGGYIHNILLEYFVKRLVNYLYIHIIQ